MKQIVSVNPFECRMWNLHDRLDEGLSEDNCRSEIESFSKHGQLVPALGRPLTGDVTHKVELIYGARRLFVARHVNLPLLVELRDLSDRDAIIAMDIENRQRADTSPYERGRAYARWLQSGHFESQDDLARTLGVSASQVSRMLRIAQLPSVIVGVFQRPADICETWGLDLSTALQDPQRRQRTITKAREIARGLSGSASRDVFRMLMAASAPGRKIKVKRRDEVIRGHDGAPLFRVRYQNNTVSLILPVEKVGEPSLERIRHAIRGILHPASMSDSDADARRARKSTLVSATSESETSGCSL